MRKYWTHLLITVLAFLIGRASVASATGHIQKFIISNEPVRQVGRGAGFKTRPTGQLGPDHPARDAGEPDKLADVGELVHIPQHCQEALHPLPG
jgi:hypothetical protein